MEERRKIRNRIEDNNLSYVWLISMLHRRYGMSLDKSQMSSTLNGTLHGEKARAIVEKSNEILDEYEKWANALMV